VKIFFPMETVPGETRVSATPDSVKKFVQLGAEVTVEKGAGEGSSIADAEFTEAGATMVDAAQGYGDATMVVRLHPPLEGELDSLKAGQTLLSFLYPLGNKEIVDALQKAKLTSIAMDQVPRISRAQSMDALSSQANLAGYKAVINAAEHLPKIFPLLMTAAGAIKPARVVILGAGVAGLQAVATAKRLGAIVQVSDIRPAVKEQVESLGGKFIEVETSADAEDAGGYAKEASEDFKKKQEEALRACLKEADVVICTALIPGRPAPRLLTTDMVQLMRAGGVIVDLAAERGGNCELTKPGEVVTAHGITIVGKMFTPAQVPVHASQMYARNIFNLVKPMIVEGELTFDFEDEIIQGSVITKDGELVHEATKNSLNGGSNG